MFLIEKNGGLFFEVSESEAYDEALSSIPFLLRNPDSVKRIFLTLAVIAVLLLATSVVLGLNIGDAKSLETVEQSRISTHMLTGLAALTFGILVHAITLTYFMGTGRWVEETSSAYSLDETFYKQNQKIKYGLLPGITLCVVLLITTGALGAVADPATPMSLDGTLGLTSAQIHLIVAVLTLIMNLLAYFTQFVAIAKNMQVIEAVLQEVRRIREERGLPVE